MMELLLCSSSMSQVVFWRLFWFSRLVWAAGWLWSTFSLTKLLAKFSLSLWDVEFFKLPHDGLWVGLFFCVSAFFCVCFDVG
jgi:hypothetical protein